MNYRADSEGVPCVNVLVDFTEQEWYKVLTREVTPIIQLEERALVAAEMSMLWAPQNPRGFLIYGYQGKGGYNLMNVFDPKAGGAMVVVVLPEGRPLGVEQIRDNFLHPTSESMATYAKTILGEDDGDDIDADLTPTRGEVIILSSEESAESYQDLIHHFARAGPPRGTIHEPVADDVDTPIMNPQDGTADQVETRKKKKNDKNEEKKAEEPVAETPRKRPSNSSFLDYVARDPNDDTTLTEIMKKKKVLEDKKKELDAQAATALAEKKSKLQKDTATAPSESEIDLGVFSEKTGNRLEKLFKSVSGSRAPKSGRGALKIYISKITHPTSPLSKPFDLSPHRPDLKGKGKEDDVEVEQVGNVMEDVVAGAERGGAHAEGVETEDEFSEATP
ncbi:hypothetical protein Hanom_Chr00s000001g01593531 [Helianthus anomalus]